MVTLEKSQLLFIDVQQRLLPAMYGMTAFSDAVSILASAARMLGVPTTISEQNPDRLGASAAFLTDNCEQASVFEKVTFSCAADPHLMSSIREKASEQGRTQLVLAGMEAHICVLLSALEFAEAGLEVVIAAEAVSSRHPDDLGRALSAAAARGVTVLPLETILFGWCRDYQHPQFKQISALVRDRIAERG